MSEENQKVPFYKKTWFIILMLTFVFPVGLILMWMHKDWSKKVKGIVTAATLLFALSVYTTDDDTEETAGTTDEEVAADESEEPSEEEALADEESAEEDVEESVEAEEETEEPAEEESTEDEAEESTEEELTEEDSEIEEETAEVEKEVEDESEIAYEMIDDIAVFTDAREPTFSVNNMLNIFSNDMANNLKEYHDDIENGAIFRLANTLEDDYGNEEQIYTIVVYYSQDTIERIDYDNWPSMVATGLYDSADGVLLHPVAEDNDHTGPKRMDNPPYVYLNMFGATHEE